MAETKYRNKPFTDFNSYYIIYYEGNNIDAFKDFFFNKKTISFLGPYRSLDYAKKECSNISRGAFIYYSDKRENIIIIKKWCSKWINGLGYQKFLYK